MDDDGKFDDIGTCISSNYCNSTFSWDFGKHTRTFPNSKRGLPEMPVNEGYSIFTTYINFLNQFLVDTVESNLSSIFLNLVEDDASMAPLFSEV